MSAKSLGVYFVFLEIKDVDILNLLISLRAIFSGELKETAIHLTVRGPYSKAIPNEKLNSWQSLLEEEPFLVGNVGKFNNKDEHVVYLRIENELLRKVWHKPDFPIKKYGFNPHVTLYKGRDKDRAEKVYKFLKREGIALLAYSYSLECHKSKDLKLFSPKSISPNHNFQYLINLGKIKFDILERAMDAVDDCRFKGLLPVHRNPYGGSC